MIVEIQMLVAAIVSYRIESMSMSVWATRGDPSESAVKFETFER